MLDFTGRAVALAGSKANGAPNANAQEAAEDTAQKSPTDRSTLPGAPS